MTAAADGADVVVVGGGPVGLMAALHARRRGLSVVVVEPRTGLVDKACGEGIMPRGVAELAAVGVEVPGAPITGIVYADARRTARAPFRTGQGLGVRRTVLRATLLDAAESAGARMLADAVAGVRTVAGLRTVAGVRTVAGSRTVAGEVETLLRGGEVLHSRYVIAADGLHSPTRRRLGLDRPVRRWPRRYGLVTHAAVDGPVPNSVHVLWGPHSELYLTPVGVDDRGRGQVGVALLTSRREPLSEQLTPFADRLSRLGVEVGSATQVRGAGPLRQRASARVAGRVLLVGDAAGYVDAVTGEGLSLGFAQARLAVEAIAAGRPSSYENAWRRTVFEPFTMTGALVAATRADSVRRRIVPAATAAPWLFGGIVNRLARG